MRLWLIAASVAAAWLVPVAGSAVFRREGTPRQVIAFSLASLVAIATALIVGLGTVLDPSALPVRDLPTLIGRCVDAAGRILEHPLRHWPRIAAALLLVVVIVRLIWALVSTVRDARSRLKVVDAIGREVPSSDRGGMDVLVVPSDDPFAFTVGLRRRRVVVSASLFTYLEEDECVAVLAHERAHVRSAHSFLLTAGAVLSRAFPFFPPVRLCADQLLAGLEMAADAAAARAVGDPLVVARALVALAPHAPRGRLGLGVAEAAISDRVQRLIRSGAPPTWVPRIRVGSILFSMASLVFILLLVLPASARVLGGDGRAIAIHAACHLPHVI